MCMKRGALYARIKKSIPRCYKCGEMHDARRDCTSQRLTFAESTAAYDSWRARHAAWLAAMVEWAEGEIRNGALHSRGQ